MNSKRLCLCFLIFWGGFSARSQPYYDTLKIAQYNILRYGAPGIECTPLSVEAKNVHLKVYLDYMLPDILVINEIGNSQSTVNSLLGVLNSSGRGYYRAARLVANGDNIGDIVYFDSDKWALLSQNTISCSVRSGFIYEFKHKPLRDDSPVLYLVNVHLKAGDNTSDANSRSSCVNNIFSHLSGTVNRKANYFIAGDFNIYSTTESAYQTLTGYANTRYTFVDPIYALTSLSGSDYVYSGNNNSVPTGTYNQSSFAKYHTQSTRTAQFECGSNGGMDDRFDYILFNRSVMNDSLDINYIPGTYSVTGNDGLRYNGSLIYGANNAAPSAVVQAMYNISDHLPVEARFRVGAGAHVLSTVSAVYTGGILTASGAAINLNALMVRNVASSVSYTLLGTAASLTDSLLTPLSAGTVTVLGRTRRVYGYASTQFAQLISIAGEYVDPAIVRGKYTTTGSYIVIEGSSRTISGTYFLGSPNRLTVIGTSLSISGHTFAGTFTGVQTITGNQMVFVVQQELYSVDSSITSATMPWEVEMRLYAVENKFKISASTKEEAHLDICNTQGLWVYTMPWPREATEVDVPQLGSGLYLCRLRLLESKRVLNIKFLK